MPWRRKPKPRFEIIIKPNRFYLPKKGGFNLTVWDRKDGIGEIVVSSEWYPTIPDAQTGAAEAISEWDSSYVVLFV